MLTADNGHMIFVLIVDCFRFIYLIIYPQTYEALGMCRPRFLAQHYDNKGIAGQYVGYNSWIKI